MIAVISTIKNEAERSKATEIYKMYCSTMLYVAKSILKDNASAEDAVSESMIKIIKNLGKISDISCHKTKGYIVIIVRNTALSLLSKYKNRKEDSDELLHEIADTDISALDELTNEESLNFINKAVLSLPKPLSDVLYLSIVNGYDNKEISRLLNINYDLVRKRLSRAKKAVRKILSETGEVYGGQKRKNL